MSCCFFLAGISLAAGSKKYFLFHEGFGPFCPKELNTIRNWTAADLSAGWVIVLGCLCISLVPRGCSGIVQPAGQTVGWVLVHMNSAPWLECEYSGGHRELDMLWQMRFKLSLSPTYSQLFIPIGLSAGLFPSIASPQNHKSNFEFVQSEREHNFSLCQSCLYTWVKVSNFPLSLQT